MQIASAQIQDTGRYTCEATNVAGKTEKNYNLNVWGKSLSECSRVSEGTTLPSVKDNSMGSGQVWCKVGNNVVHYGCRRI